MKKEAKLAAAVGAAVMLGLVGFIATRGGSEPPAAQAPATEAKAPTQANANAPQEPTLIKEVPPATPPTAEGQTLAGAAGTAPTGTAPNAAAPAAATPQGGLTPPSGTAAAPADPTKKADEKKDIAVASANPLPATHLAKDNCVCDTKPVAKAKKSVKRSVKVKRKPASTKTPAPSLTVYAEQGGRIWVAPSETNGTNVQSYAVGDKMSNGAVIKSVKRSNQPSGRVFVIQTDKGTVVAR